jgi:hypothetical protein
MIVETGTKKRVLFVSYADLPKPIKESVREWIGFSNDCVLPLSSEFDVEAYREGMKAVEDYKSDQKFKGTTEEFIKAYGLEFDVWFIGQNFDLTDVDLILVNVCW